MAIRVYVRANRPPSVAFLKAGLFALAFTAAGVNAFGQISSGSAYTVVNRATAQAIDDPNGIAKANEPQQEWACNGNTQQNWIFTSVGSGYYTLQNQKSSMYLDTDGTSVVENSKSGGASQNWLPNYIGNGFYYITNQASGDVLEVPSGNTTNGTPLDQNPTNGDYLYQQWYVTTADTCRTGQFSSSAFAWTAVSIPPPQSGYTENLLALFGTITMNDPSNSFAETLFGVGFISSGCSSGSGNLPASSWNYILKSVTAQTISVPISYWISGGLGIPGPTTSDCLFFGTETSSPSTINLAAIVGTEPTNGIYEAGLGGEACFNVAGCEVGNLNPETESFETIYRISTAGTLDYIFGNVSDATKSTVPSGPWIAKTDLYVFHGSSECSDTNGSTWYWNINAVPGDANLLMDLEEFGNGAGVGQQGVFQTLNFPLNAGDCLVTLTGVPTDPGQGQLDNETQIYAVITPN